LARHGTRNPGKKDIKKINEGGSFLRAKILENSNRTAFSCIEDTDKLRNWSFNLTEGIKE